jgi:hypothetical protein
MKRIHTAALSAALLCTAVPAYAGMGACSASFGLSKLRGFSRAPKQKPQSLKPTDSALLRRSPGLIRQNGSANRQGRGLRLSRWSVERTAGLKTGAFP